MVLTMCCPSRFLVACFLSKTCKWHTKEHICTNKEKLSTAPGGHSVPSDCYVRLVWWSWTVAFWVLCSLLCCDFMLLILLLCVYYLCIVVFARLCVCYMLCVFPCFVFVCLVLRFIVFVVCCLWWWYVFLCVFLLLLFCFILYTNMLENIIKRMLPE